MSVFARHHCRLFMGAPHDRAGTQRWVSRYNAAASRRRIAVGAQHRGPARRWSADGSPLPRFAPALRSVTANAEELWQHHGTDSDRAFGRVVHAVLHQGLLEAQTDPLTQRLLGLLHDMRRGPQRTELERQLITHEMRRASRLLETCWDAEKANFGGDLEAWKKRAADYVGRYVATDDYLFAKLWRYPLGSGKGQTKLVPMLEFPFRVRTRSGVTLVGRFDRVDERESRPVVIDYKTGPPRSMTALRHDHQLLLYAAAIADLTGARSVTCEIHWLSTGTKSTLVFSGAELRRAREEAARYVRQMERHALYGTPRPESHSAEPMPRPGAQPKPEVEGPAAA